MIRIAQPLIGVAEEKAVLKVLKSGMLVQGPVVRRFEKKFAEYIGTKHAVATNNGTSALHASLLSLDIQKGDEIITTPFSFIASANSILYVGARPVFADIDPKTFNVDPEQIKEKITGKTKALLIVHLYGQPCDMDLITEICEDYDLKLIEDCSQSHGAECKGKKVGSFGDCATFSFYSTKNITTGEGGMITTGNDKIAGRARLVRAHGSRKKYRHEILGYNYRMTDISAAIGIEQLKKLDEMNKRRIKNAKMLTKSIKNIKGLILPHTIPKVKHVFHQYTIRVTDEFFLSRNELAGGLNKKGIETKIHYPLPIHKQELYQKLDYHEHLPVAEKASREVLSLPVHPGVSEEEVEYITATLQSVG